ncbi:MAG: Nif3-like dinuclear metal center hexameric protein [Clostridia bacterium]|nr:Nif3-like dinuclear metal center hexameric protein [Clostridia bacterium]
MTVRELYEYLNEKIPRSLSCEWDNDGLMCCPDDSAPVRRVLVALDVTDEIARIAVEEGYDVILSHHPLVFRPLRALEGSNFVASKVIKLLLAGVSVMSFHTRLDAVEGGVNDVLCQALGILDVSVLADGEERIARIGHLEAPITLAEFAERVKAATGARMLAVSDADKPVSTVALMGGSGGDAVSAARAAGADTYLTGELSHHALTDAPEMGINLIAGGHFETEHLVCDRLRDLVLEADASIEVTVRSSNRIQIL